MLKKIGLVVLVLSFVFVMGTGSANAVLTLADLALTSDGALTITGSTTGIITLGSSSGAQTLNLGTGAGASTVNIATGAALNTIRIGSKTVDGTNTILYGRLKVDNRLAGAGGTLGEDALQIRSEYAGTGTAEHNGIDSQSDLVANSGATLIGIKGVVDVKTGITDTGGALIGLYGQARSTGTLNSSTGQLVGVYGLLGNSAALTVGQAAAGWFDSRQASGNAITGQHELLLLTNTGTATLDQAILVDGTGLTADENLGGGIGTFIKFTNGTDYTDGVQTATVTPGATADAVIKIMIGSTAYYIPAYAAGSITGE